MFHPHIRRRYSRFCQYHGCHHTKDINELYLFIVLLVILIFALFFSLHLDLIREVFINSKLTRISTNNSNTYPPSCSLNTVDMLSLRVYSGYILLVWLSNTNRFSRLTEWHLFLDYYFSTPPPSPDPSVHGCLSATAFRVIYSIWHFYIGRFNWNWRVVRTRFHV